jgi:hypothetical protein
MLSQYLIVTPYSHGYAKLTYKTMTMCSHILNKYKNLLRSQKITPDYVLKQISYQIGFRLYNFEEWNHLCDCVHFPRFNSNNSKGGKRKIFDMTVDFDVIYHDFKINGICDLIDEDIDWLRFNFHLASFMNSQTSAIALRVQERENNKSETQYPMSKALIY